MGLFSSKKKTKVASSTINMGGDKKRKKFMAEVIFNTIVAEGDADLSENITNSLLYGGGSKLRRYYRYGRDRYSQGLPVGSVSADNTANTFLKEFVENNIAQGKIYAIESYIGVADYQFWVNQYLTETYGYDPETNFWLTRPVDVPDNYRDSYETEVDAQGKLRVYLTFYPEDVDDDDIDEDSTIRILTPLDLTGITVNKRYANLVYRDIADQPEPVPDVTIREYLDGDKEDEIVTRERAINSDTGEMTDTRTVTKITIEEYKSPESEVGEYPEGTTVTITTVTKYIDILSNPIYFEYVIGSGIYPELDDYYKDASNNHASDYFPIVFFREWKDDLFRPAYKNTARYKTATQMLKIINMNAQEIRKSLNKNKDVGSVNHAYMVVGVSLNTNEQVALDYLVEHFKYWSQILPYTKSDALKNPNINQSIRISKDTYDVYIRLKYAHATTKIGVIGRVGHCTKARGTVEDEFETRPPVYDENGNQVSGGTTVARRNSVVYFRKQTTPATYQEVEVANLTYTNYIYKGKSTGISAWDALYAKEEQFIVPLLYSVQRRMGLNKLTQLTKDCYHMTFNSYVVKKIKWYQSLFGSAGFKIVLAVIAVVVTIYSVGSLSAGIVAAASAATAAGTSVFMAVSSYIAMALTTGIVISAGAKFLADAVGMEFFTILVSIAVLYVGMSNIGKATGTINGLPFASEITTAIPAVIKAGQDKQKDDFKNLQKDMGKFAMFAEEKQEEIDKAWEEFTANQISLDYRSMIAANPHLSESVDAFLFRTLMTDPNTVALESLTGFVDRMLELPIGRLPTDYFQQPNLE